MKMKSTIIFMIGILLIVTGLTSLAVSLDYKNLEDIKSHSTEAFNNAGFQVTSYEGYTWNPILGAEVNYLIKKPGSATVYKAALYKWGDNEYNIWCIVNIDAMKQQN